MLTVTPIFSVAVYSSLRGICRIYSNFSYTEQDDTVAFLERCDFMYNQELVVSQTEALGNRKRERERETETEALRLSKQTQRLGFLLKRWRSQKVELKEVRSYNLIRLHPWHQLSQHTCITQANFVPRARHTEAMHGCFPK